MVEIYLKEESRRINSIRSADSPADSTVRHVAVLVRDARRKILLSLLDPVV